jgi:alpha-1,3-rhamnosyl/mannosyltransferase
MPYRPKIPTVLTVYDLIPLIFPDYVSTQARLFFYLTTKLALRTANILIAISQSTKQDYLNRFRISPEQVKVIPLAVSSDFHPQPRGLITRIRERYNLPPKFLLYVGINKPHKNLLRLIDAWSLLMRETIGDYYLCIAGEWDERYEMPKRKVARLGLEEQVKFLGPIREEDLPGLYAAAVGFVFPSLYEGFGLPVLEAMACGTPVACSNISSLTEIVGKAAVLFNPNSTESIADVLEPLITENKLRDDLRDLGFDRAKRFTWEGTARDTLQVYREFTKYEI